MSGWRAGTSIHGTFTQLCAWSSQNGRRAWLHSVSVPQRAFDGVIFESRAC